MQGQSIRRRMRSDWVGDLGGAPNAGVMSSMMMAMRNHLYTFLSWLASITRAQLDPYKVTVKQAATPPEQESVN